MDNQFPADPSFSEMMRKSKLTMPSDDFEERTMARVYKENGRRSVSKYRKLAAIFLIIGAGVGFAITYFLSLPETNIIGVYSDTILLSCRVGYVLFVLIQSDYVFKLFLKPGNHRLPDHYKGQSEICK